MITDIANKNCENFYNWYMIEYSNDKINNNHDDFILKKLFVFMRENNINLSEINEEDCLNKIKNKVLNQQELIPASEIVNLTFTVGELLDKIYHLPKDLPVVIARIEDEYFTKHQWKSYLFKWETMNKPNSDKSYQELLEYMKTNPDIAEEDSKNGKLIWQYTEYIYAFNAMCTSNKDGKYAFCITPHY